MLKPIISADSHIVEPPDTYIDRIDNKFKDRAPTLVHDERRGDVFIVEGSKSPIPLALVSAAGKAPEALSPRGAVWDKLPSDYFREHIYFTFQDDYTAFMFKDQMNIRRMMWANDYPHSDSTWPWSQDILKQQLAHMSEDEKNLVLHDNVANLYKLDTSNLKLCTAPHN